MRQGAYSDVRKKRHNIGCFLKWPCDMGHLGIDMKVIKIVTRDVPISSKDMQHLGSPVKGPAQMHAGRGR